MSTIAPAAQSVNWTSPATVTDTYRHKATATRSRRQAAGRYNRPSAAQKAAYAKAVSRGGRASLTAEECGLLAAHPHLAASQRAEFAAMAQARIESAVK